MACSIALAAAMLFVFAGSGFEDVTDAVGLGPAFVPETVSRLCFADLNTDGYPDAVIDRHRVFLNEPDLESPIGRRFVEVHPESTGLPEPDRSALAVFADLDNDGRLDAIVCEHIDTLNEKWTDHGRRTGWHRGRGDGTFGPREALPAPPRTTVSIAAADVDRDGRLDLYIGNTYRLYGGGYEGYPNDLLVSDEMVEGGRWERTPLAEDGYAFDDESDLGGRPTFGTLVFSPTASEVVLLELSYGRRWNRAWRRVDSTWRDVAPEWGLDGDDIRHGRHPEWLAERAKTDPRFDREDEKPFRANGNTFDAAVGDVDGDGRFDLLISEITHAWAGDSSDRTRVLRERPDAAGNPVYRPDARYDLDRIPTDLQSWNQGDLFCALADLDHDGRLDVIVSSGDYPDDERLRIFLQDSAGSLRDATAELGIDHDGSQQFSLADVDGDGDLDLLAGQTFNRFTKEQREGRSPRIRLFANVATAGRASITIRLRGDGECVNRDALGSIVRARLAGDRVIVRQVVGIGGHAGKQHDFAVHLGLGEATEAAELIVEWPEAAGTVQRFPDVAAGRYTLEFGGRLERIER